MFDAIFFLLSLLLISEDCPATNTTLASQLRTPKTYTQSLESHTNPSSLSLIQIYDDNGYDHNIVPMIMMLMVVAMVLVLMMASVSMTMMSRNGRRRHLNA